MFSFMMSDTYNLSDPDVTALNMPAYIFAMDNYSAQTFKSGHEQFVEPGPYLLPYIHPCLSKWIGEMDRMLQLSPEHAPAPHESIKPSILFDVSRNKAIAVSDFLDVFVEHVYMPYLSEWLSSDFLKTIDGTLYFSGKERSRLTKINQERISSNWRPCRPTCMVSCILSSAQPRESCITLKVSCA